MTGWANAVVVIVIVAILGLSIAYIVREKKKGVRCIGCPDGGTCGGNCGGNCSSQCGGNCHSDAR